MPTYAFRCGECGRVSEVMLTIHEYVTNRPTLLCCLHPMERYITVAPAMALSNALAGDRHYDGLRATDGTDISTRAKHRAYMRERNLTTIDDYAETWKRDAEKRAATMAGDDPTRGRDVAAAIDKLGG